MYFGIKGVLFCLIREWVFEILQRLMQGQGHQTLDHQGQQSCLYIQCSIC